MIVGFKSDDTQRIFEGLTSRRYPAEIQVAALRKLLMLQAAISVNDLAHLPATGWRS